MKKTKSSVRSSDLLNKILKCVSDEEEMPGAMPDEMWAAIRGDRDAVEQAFKLTVKVAKMNITNRIANLFNTDLSGADSASRSKDLLGKGKL